MILLDKTFWKITHTKDRGRGIVAAKMIPAGTLIGEYIGEVVRADDLDDDIDTHHEELYYAQISETQAVMPKKADTGVHTINHSCEATIAFLPHAGHILYVTIRAIFPGEELTVNYLVDPDFGELNYFTCYCGAPTCKGTWYIHPDKLKGFDKLMTRSIAEQSEADKQIPFGTILPPLKTYPKQFKDNPFYDLFGAEHEKPEVRDTETQLPSIHEMRAIIRETGRQIRYSKMNIQIRGVTGDMINCYVPD